MGAVKYTEIWLVDKSGRFQLDTLDRRSTIGHYALARRLSQRISTPTAGSF